ncbi:MAG: tRNA-dihydrouridine synthase [Patescibacteria group bacterium]|nr:tRNA-dihydrouridine synthase [Patescibacteria group bacterium]MBU1953162.1 tRNA-dihydrouridine synthase [Patescibacteria group bacterium]
MSNFWKKLSKPFTALAPMDGVTDFVFREIVCEIAKPDVLFTEFTPTDAIVSKGYNRVIGNLKYSEKQRLIVAQIWGIHPENFYKTAKLCKNLKFDGIDINMGCPDKNVVKIGSGAALINNKKLAEEIIKATKKGAGNIPVSVKTRIGFAEVVTENWISFLLKQDIDAISIHGRTAKEMSKGRADWDEIAKTVKLRDTLSPKTVIIGNGDVLSYKEVLEKSEKYGVDGVMIGRGIFSNPWIFEKTQNPLSHSTEEHLRLLTKHTKLFCDTYRNEKDFNTMKKFFKIYVRSFRGAGKIKKQLMECKNHEDVERVVLPYLSNLTTP